MIKLIIAGIIVAVVATMITEWINKKYLNKDGDK